jgi:hypothetical protein
MAATMIAPVVDVAVPDVGTDCVSWRLKYLEYKEYVAENLHLAGASSCCPPPPRRWPGTAARIVPRQCGVGRIRQRGRRFRQR